MGELFVGTSGWVYKGWAGAFYPEDLAAAKRLAFYASQFQSVEINATFYRLPTPNMVRGWAQQAPPGFSFAAKGSRFISHFKRLKLLKPSVAIFFRRIQALKEHLGPILWQLPPNMPKDLARLEAFFKKLPAGYQHAVEFRHPSWNDEEVISFLQEHKAGLSRPASRRSAV